MLTWLKANSRRAARPAPLSRKPEPPTPAPAPIDDEMPPPFFADEDAAFLDMGEVTPPVAMTPPPLPAPADVRLAKALAALPPWPELGVPGRTEQLLDILRQLDRIAGDACAAMERA